MGSVIVDPITPLNTTLLTAAFSSVVTIEQHVSVRGATNFPLDALESLLSVGSQIEESDTSPAIALLENDDLQLGALTMKDLASAVVGSQLFVRNLNGGLCLTEDNAGISTSNQTQFSWVDDERLNIIYALGASCHSCPYFNVSGNLLVSIEPRVQLDEYYCTTVCTDPGCPKVSTSSVTLRTTLELKTFAFQNFTVIAGSLEISPHTDA